jgi:hypothetical protein
LRALQHHPFYLDAADLLGGQPFTKPITFSDDAPQELRDPRGAWREDIDGSRRTLQQLARQSCINSTKSGFILLWPRFIPGGSRPFMETIPSEAVLDRYIPGNPVRIKFTSHEILNAAKPWILTPIEQIWMFMDAGIQDPDFATIVVFEHQDRADPKSDWNETPTPDLGAILKPLTEIPLYPLYTGHASPPELGELVHDPWVTMPPLYALAKMNQVYDSKRSDLDWGLHIGNIPQRAAKGITKEEMELINKVSYSGLWALENVNGLFYFVEPSGKTFALAAEDLSDMERRMGIIGNSPNVTRSDARGNVLTATGELREMAPAIMEGQSWAKNWQDTWETALRTLARIVRLPDTFKVKFDTNFGPKDQDLDRWRVVQTDRQRKEISARQYFDVSKELGGYPETFNAEDAAEFADAQEAERKELARLRESNSDPPTTDEEAE